MKTTKFYPQSMKKMKRWVLWKKEINKKGEPTKVPYSANYEGKAVSTNPNTWSTFDNAKYMCEKGKYNGVGFMFYEKDNLVFIDIDHCFVNGELTDQAKDIVNRFQNTYMEISQSGEGIHIIAIGKIERNFNNRNTHIEMYYKERYVAFTGDAINPCEPVNCQESIDYVFNQNKTEKSECITRKSTVMYVCNLTDMEIVEKARNGKNGAKFNDLYCGNWQAYYSSQSEADMGLCDYLAFYSNRNGSAIDRIFRSSGLFRDKWLRKDYRLNTIEKAIAGCDKSLFELQAEARAEKRKERKSTDIWQKNLTS